MKKLILYSTVGCHLCELALALLDPLLDEETVLEEVDISESHTLIEQYGIRIPVIVRVADGAELDWPFDRHQLHTFLKLP